MAFKTTNLREEGVTMAELFFDSFDHYAIGDFTKEWNKRILSPRVSGPVDVRVDRQIKFASPPSSEETILFDWANYDGTLYELRITTTGALAFYCGGSVLLASNSGIVKFTDEWQLVEITLTAKSSMIAVEVRLNHGNPVLSIVPYPFSISPHHPERAAP